MRIAAKWMRVKADELEAEANQPHPYLGSQALEATEPEGRDGEEPDGDENDNG